MFDKILDKISNKVSQTITPTKLQKINNFPQARNRLIEKMMKNETVSEVIVNRIAILLTFFGCGKVRYAQGTLASFVTVVLWLGVSLFFFNFEVETFYELVFWSIIIALLFVYGLLFIPLYSKSVGADDHPSIVIDEVVGQLTALVFTYPFVKEYYFEESWFLSKLIMGAHMFSCFIFFRFFDIAKPFFIGWIDRNLKNSFGVMVDDLICGIITAAINIAIFMIYQDALLKLHSS